MNSLAQVGAEQGQSYGTAGLDEKGWVGNHQPPSLRNSCYPIGQWFSNV